MRKLLFWSIMGPIGLLVVLFAASNREMMTLSLWPLPFEVTAPVFIPAVGGLAIGFLMGAVMVWFQGGKHRRRTRAAETKADQAGRENARLKQQMQGQAAQGGLPATTAQATPAAKTGQAA